MAKDRSDESLAHGTTEVASSDRSVDRRLRSGDVEADAPPSFVPDALVADRYRIVRFLARGGMGEVYEAEDTTLQQRVALKTIAPEVASDARMLDRLKREVLLARKVTHANVCRLHDLGFHNGARGSVPFLTMDLLRGDTLAVHLARKGPLDPREALPLVRQMAAALDAAHAAGVIHRDFKSRNVMLVGDTTGTGSPRAVVMDFGIAVATEEEERRALDTGEGKFVGTPAYMAPEQVSGGALSAATDVYALGVVMFEMVTGSLPFASGRALEVISMRLTQPAPEARSRVPGLDRRWNAVIARCLDRDPAKRFAGALDVVAALEKPATPLSRGGRVAIGVVAIAGVVGAAFAWNGGRAHERATTAAAPEGKRRPTLAVIGVKNETNRDDARWLATAIPEMLGTDLDADEELRVIPASRVAEARRELALGDAPSIAGDALGRVRDNLGADYVVTGSYAAGDDGALRIDLALVDTKSGATVARAEASGTTAKLFDVVSALGDPIRAKLGARDPTAAQITAARAASPSTPEAVKAYAEGEAKLHDSDYSGALAAYDEAEKLDPTFPLVHLGVAAAAAAMGYDQRALEESRKAFEMSRGLSREQQLVVEGRYRGTAKEWDRAIEVQRTLFEFFPDDADYAPPYLHALVAANRPKDALAVVDRIRASGSPVAEDPRVDLYEAIAAARIPDAEREKAAATRAIDKGRRMGSASIEADGHKQLGAAYEDMAKWDEARGEFEKASALYVKTNDRKYQADTLADMAHLDSDRGYAARAMPLLEQSLVISRQIGSRYAVAGRTLDVATVAWMLGDLTRAHATFEESRGLFEAIHDREWAAASVGRLGLVVLDEGDAPGARKKLEDAVAQLLAIDNGPMAANYMFGVIAAELEQGDLIAAQSQQRVLDAELAKLPPDAMSGMPKLIAASIAREAGDSATARKLGEEARAELRKAEANRETVQCEVLLARVAIDDGRAADGASLASQAAGEAHPLGLRNDEARALAVLATARLAAGDRDAAQAALDRATLLGPTSVPAQIELLIARASVVASTPGHGVEAVVILADARKRADAGGLGRLALEARLASSRIEPGGAAARAKIAADATAKGLTRLAKRAR